jgi:hypothetical protein
VEGAPAADYLTLLFGSASMRLPLSGDMVVYEKVYLPFRSALAFLIVGQAISQFATFWFHWYELPDPARRIGSALDA